MIYVLYNNYLRLILFFMKMKKKMIKKLIFKLKRINFSNREEKENTNHELFN